MPSTTAPEPPTPDAEIDPYEILGVASTATEAEIKTAYKKLALRHHPDKVPSSARPAAHATFLNLSHAYAILSSPSLRSRYDATGNTSLSPSSLTDPDFNWADFFRAQYAAVTSEAISSFATSYQGSAEEANDVLKAYTAYKGKMEKVYEGVMLSDMLRDEPRFREIIDKAIQDGKVEGWESYVGETEKQRKARMDRARKKADREAREAAKAKESLDKKGKKGAKGKDGEADLAALILARGKGRQDAFLSSLEAKYAPQTKGPKRKAHDTEPDEEAFVRTAARAKKAKVQVAAETEEASDRSEDLEEDEAEDVFDDEDDDEVVPKRKARTDVGRRGPRRKARVEVEDYEDEDGEDEEYGKRKRGKGQASPGKKGRAMKVGGS